MEHLTVRANGAAFHVARVGTGKPLLLLHGWPEFWLTWEPVMARLADRYTLLAPDLRGYGGSSRPVGVPAYALENLEEDVAALIEASGAKDVVLVGHDWGAVIAWYYAMFGRLPISKLIIMNVPHPALMEKGLRTRRQLAKSWYIFFFQLPWIPEWGLARRGCEAIGRVFRDMAVDKTRFPDEVLRVYREAPAAPGALTAMLNYYRALIRGLRRIRRRGIVRIDTPTLMIWGEVDAALGKELTYGTEEHVGNLTLRYLPNVSHWVQQEAPEMVNAMIEAWLLGHSVPYAPGGVPLAQGAGVKPSMMSGGS